MADLNDNVVPTSLDKKVSLIVHGIKISNKAVQNNLIIFLLKSERLSQPRCKCGTFSKLTFRLPISSVIFLSLNRLR